MQSVRLKKFSTLFRLTHTWRFFILLSPLFMSGMLMCQAQDTQPVVPKEKFDVGVGGFYQITNASNGNFIRDDTTESGGALFSLR